MYARIAGVGAVYSRVSAKRQFQLDLVANRYAVVADRRDARFETTRFLYCAGVNSRDSPAALLVKAQGGEIVVRRHQP